MIITKPIKQTSKSTTEYPRIDRSLSRLPCCIHPPFQSSLHVAAETFQTGRSLSKNEFLSNWQKALVESADKFCFLSSCVFISIDILNLFTILQDPCCHKVPKPWQIRGREQVCFGTKGNIATRKSQNKTGSGWRKSPRGISCYNAMGGIQWGSSWGEGVIWIPSLFSHLLCALSAPFTLL